MKIFTQIFAHLSKFQKNKDNIYVSFLLERIIVTQRSIAMVRFIKSISVTLRSIATKGLVKSRKSNTRNDWILPLSASG